MRRWAVIATASVIAGSATACASATGSKVSVSAVMAAAASKSEAQKTFRFTAAITGKSSGQFSGEIDLSTQSIEVTLTDDASIQNPSINLNPNDPTAATIPLPPGPSTTTVIEIGESIWVKGSLLGSRSKPWVAITKPANAPTIANDPTLDPSQILNQMKSQLKNIHIVGPATIQGVSTTEYEGSIPAPVSGPTGTGKVDAWIDSSGLVRQLKISINIEATPDSTPAVNETVTANFTDYGAPVNIAAPPASQVTVGSLKSG